MFESADPDTRVVNATDKRFFWLALYAQPVLWNVLGLVAVLRFDFISWILVGGSPVSVVAELCPAS